MTGIDLDLAGIRARAEAARRSAKGSWSTEDANYDDLQRPTRFAGPIVVYADEDCETHPVADCSCNHTCRDEQQQRDVAAHIASADPPTVIAMCDLIERQAGELSRAMLSITKQTSRAVAAEAKAKQLYEALYRLKTECEMDGLASKAGYDCWIALANAALTPKEDTPCRTA